MGVSIFTTIQIIIETDQSQLKIGTPSTQDMGFRQPLGADSNFKKKSQLPVFVAAAHISLAHILVSTLVFLVLP